MELLIAVKKNKKNKKIIFIDYYSIYSILSFLFSEFFFVFNTAELFSHSLTPGIDGSLCCFPLNFTSERRQAVQVGKSRSIFKTSNVVVPQGRVTHSSVCLVNRWLHITLLTLLWWWHLQMTPVLFGRWQMVIHILLFVNRVSRVLRGRWFTGSLAPLSKTPCHGL